MRTEHTRLCDCEGPTERRRRSHGRRSQCRYGANAKEYIRPAERREMTREVLDEVYEYGQIQIWPATDDLHGEV